MAVEKEHLSDYRKFGLSVGGLLLVLAGLLIWKGKLPAAAQVFLFTGGFLFISGLVWPSLLSLPYRGWMGFAHGLGWFNTRLLLVLVFYLIISPLGLVMRLIGKRPLNMEWEPGAGTYWIPREKKPFDPERCEKQF
ncbi:MAG: SxtJ family membrane protein [Gemmatimonadota bacterium]|nr:SxtJ family membrane protein [Gemmatimonadota bacterium]